jgi:hypothetical protein
VVRRKLTTALVLVTVICLGLSVLLAPIGRDGGAEAEALLTAPPSRITALTLTSEDGPRQTLARTAPDRWEIRVPRPGPEEDGEARWPASAERVRAFLRILDRLRGVAGEESAETPLKLGVEAEGSPAVVFGLPRGSVGGRAIVTREVDGGEAAAFVTTDELPRLLADRGFLNWLDARAFAGLPDQVERLEVVSGGSTMSIARTGGRWRITAPFETEAEPGLVEELIRSLRVLPIAEARMQANEPPEGATSIALVGTRRTPRADGTLGVERVIHTVRSLGPVGRGGRLAVLCEAQADAGGPALQGPLTASVDADRLSELVRRPGFYIARRAFRGTPGDVRGLALVTPDGRRLEFARDSEGWVSTADEAPEEHPPLPEETLRGLDALVGLLASEDAVVAAWREGDTPEGSESLGRVECLGLGGVVLLEADLAVATLPEPSDDRRAHALISTGSVDRYYTPEAALAAVRWLAGLTP